MSESKIACYKRLLSRFICRIIGIQKDEIVKVLFTFAALFFLMVSYYLIKPLREALYFREFGAEFLPIFHLIVILASIVLTYIFHQLLGRIPKSRVLDFTYPTVALIHISFVILLNHPSKMIIISFCLWSSIYFLLCLALLWGVTNQRFSSDGGRSSYSFIWLGAILGAVAGSKISVFLSQKDVYAPNLVLSALILVFAYWFLNLACPQDSAEVKLHSKLDDSPSQGKIRDLFKSSYLLGVAVLILALTFCRSVFDYTTNGMVERQLSLQILKDSYGSHTNGLESEREDAVLETVLRIKNVRGDFRNELFKLTLNDLPESWQLNPAEGFKHYQDRLQQKTAIFFGEVYLYQNCLGVLLLLMLKGGLIKIMGIPSILLVLPCLYFFSSIALIFTLEIELIQFLKIITGAVDYSWNNTGKELLYVPLDFEANLRFKPVIEGPIFRLGGALAAFSKIGMDQVFVAAKAANYLIFITVLLIFLWMKFASAVGGKCEELNTEALPKN